MNEKKDILLINPPFGPVASPYIAIPVLASYLKSKHVKVDVFDLNCEFFYRLYQPQRIRHGFDYCVERIEALNQKPQLNFQEAIEMRYIVLLLSKFPMYQHEIKALVMPFTDFSDTRGFKSNNLFAAFVTLRHFPEFIFTTPLSIAMTEYSYFSSQDIMTYSGRSDFYTDEFREIITQELKDRVPRCVGFSVPFSPQIVPAFQCAKIIREIAPETHITMGGPSISIFFRETNVKAFFEIVDSFVLDEGEIPLEMLNLELSKKNPVLENVPGLVYLSGGEFCKNPLPPPMDMEKTPPPDYTVYPLHKYLKPQEKMTLTMPLSKGCHWKKCSFCRTRLPMTYHCQQPDKKMLYRNLLQLIEKTGIRKYFFSDEASKPEVLEYIAKNLIKDNIQITWRSHGKISWQLTQKRCQLFKEAGCIKYYLGIESLTNRILKNMKKGITAEMIDKVLKEINGVIPVGAYMMVGYPTETEEEAMNGYKKINDYMTSGLLSEYYYSIFSIFYGSEISINPEAFGISEIQPPEGQDLLPDLFFFKTSGMARKKAFQLYREFSGINKLVEEVAHCKELRIWDKIIPLRYDLSKIVEVEKELLDVTETPFIQWLREANLTTAPFTPIK